MKSNSKTIKFFISSTFKDFLKERNALQEFVFPKLKILCQSKGFSFQPVDLRWGVIPEASDDNQTMNFCLNEVKRCSSDPKPNLLVLLGQRYGWGPLPSSITQEEYVHITKYHHDNELFDQWYIKDENDIDKKYFLKDKKNLSKNKWEDIEKKLKTHINTATENIPKYEEFQKSATELEIRDALKHFEGSKENTLIYIREFDDISDKDYYEDDKKLTQLKKDLQNPTYAVIKKSNISLDAYKDSDKDEEEFSKLSKDLQEFCSKILDYYKKIISQEMKDYIKVSDLNIELQEQINFLNSKSKVVLGRKNEVKEIKNFICNSNEQYYLLYGKSGSGKSSVLAKTIFATFNLKHDDKPEVRKQKLSAEYKVIYRFIGTTAHTSTPRDTYEYIYWELQENTKEKPFIEYDDHEFYQQFREALKSYKKKIIFFMDAVDQFNIYDDLNIFLEKLPDNIKIIFSTLSEHKSEDNIDTLYFNRLQNSISNSKELNILTNSNKDILRKWLKDTGRTLTTNQLKYLLKKCKGQTPLYLRLAFIIAKEWKSSYKDYDKDIEGSEKDLILKFFEKLTVNHYHKSNLIERVLGFISASKDGLSELELIDLLSREKDILEYYERKNSDYPKLSKLPDAIFSRLYFNIQEFFTAKLIDEEMLIVPFHRIISETIRDKYYKINDIYLHKKLADYFLTLQDNARIWDKRYNNIHMLSETPYQLVHAKDSKRLKDILFDLEFAGSVYDNYKQESFKEVLEKAKQLDSISENEIHSIRSFYDDNTHKILKFNNESWKPHNSLYQLAFNDAIDSPLSQVAKGYFKTGKVDFKFLELKNKRNKSISQGLNTYIYLDENILDVKYIKALDYIVVLTQSSLLAYNLFGKLIYKNKNHGEDRIHYLADSFILLTSFREYTIVCMKDYKVKFKINKYASIKKNKEIRIGNSLKVQLFFQEPEELKSNPQIFIKIIGKNGKKLYPIFINNDYLRDCKYDTIYKYNNIIMKKTDYSNNIIVYSGDKELVLDFHQEFVENILFLKKKNYLSFSEHEICIFSLDKYSFSSESSFREKIRFVKKPLPKNKVIMKEQSPDEDTYKAFPNNKLLAIKEENKLVLYEDHEKKTKHKILSNELQYQYDVVGNQYIVVREQENDLYSSSEVSYLVTIYDLDGNLLLKNETLDKFKFMDMEVYNKRDFLVCFLDSGAINIIYNTSIGMEEYFFNDKVALLNMFGYLTIIDNQKFINIDFSKYITMNSHEHEINFNYYQLNQNMLFWHKEQGLSIVVNYQNNTYNVRQWPKDIEKIYHKDFSNLLLVSKEHIYLYDLIKEEIRYSIPILESGDFNILEVDENGIYIEKNHEILLYHELKIS